MDVQTIRQDNGYWSLVVDGKVIMRDESYQVVSNVAYELTNGPTGEISECAEIANAIREG